MASTDPVPIRTARTIRIVLPASVAYDEKKFARVVANLGDLTGCRPCNSGAICIFDIHSNYTVDEKTMRLEAMGSRYEHASVSQM